MGDEREIPKPDTQYLGIDHKQLKSWTDAGEPGDADGLAQTWKDMGSGLTEAAENLMVAVFGSEAGWTGKAADAMRAQLQKVAEWSQKTGDSFTKASEAFVTQGESVGTAKTSMPDPVDYNPGRMIKDAASSGSLVQIALLPYEMHKQAEAQKEAHAEAAVVVARRDAQLAAAAQAIPPFAAPPTLAGDKPPTPGPQDPRVPGGSGFSGGQVPPGSAQPGPGLPGGPGGPGGPNGSPGGSGPGDPGSNNNDKLPPNTTVPSMPVGSGTGAAGFSPGPPPNFTPPGPGVSGGPAAAGGGGGFGGAFGGGFGPGAAAPRPGGGFGPMGPGAATGAASGVPGSGVSGGARGKGGAGAGGMGAGQRGEGGEDEQHQRPSYLVEPDPDAMFGTDQMTAPPVIGG